MTADIGSHDDYRILEINHPALSVSKTTVIQNLQKNIEYFRMSFLDFIKQNQTVAMADDFVS